MVLSKLKAKLLATKNSTQNLYIWNRWLAVIYALQGVIILLLSTTKLLPVQTNYLAVNPIGSEIAKGSVLSNASQHLFDINLAYVVALFFFVAAVAHGVISTVYRKRYEADLKQNLNKIRWYEYIITDSLRLVAIALVCGVADLSLLVALVFLAAATNLTSLVMELKSPKGKNANWVLFGSSILTGLAPWVVLAINLIASSSYGGGAIDSAVYWVFGTMFVLFVAFGANFYLIYKKIGLWKEYAHGERGFLIISLMANTALAWQLFASVLRP